MNNLTKRQRVLRMRKITRAVAKEKRAVAFASAKAFAEANPAQPLERSSHLRKRTMLQMISGLNRDTVSPNRVIAIRQLLDVKQMQNEAVTLTWMKYIAAELAKRSPAPLELKLL